MTGCGARLGENDVCGYFLIRGCIACTAVLSAASLGVALRLARGLRESRLPSTGFVSALGSGILREIFRLVRFFAAHECPQAPS